LHEFGYLVHFDLLRLKIRYGVALPGVFDSARGGSGARTSTARFGRDGPEEVAPGDVLETWW
jgi:hypothetical protein